MKKYFYFAFVCLLASGCATNYSVKYQVDARSTGTITIKPSNPTDKTSVTVNDNLVIDNKSGVKSVIIENVPAGDYAVVYSSNNKSYKNPLYESMNVQVEPGKETTKLITTPAYSGGYWAIIGISMVTSLAIIAATL